MHQKGWRCGKEPIQIQQILNRSQRAKQSVVNEMVVEEQLLLA